MSDELEYTNLYLSLEKVRFEDDLTIEYDIKTDDFYVPVLSVQTMVENAIKHGIRKNENGIGILKIITEKSEQNYIVKIVDNGVGFDTKKIDTLDSTHIGIRNVSERIKKECNGKLIINSAPNKGTEVKIIIPSNYNEVDNN